MTRGEGEGGKKLRSVVTALQKSKNGLSASFHKPIQNVFSKKIQNDMMSYLILEYLSA